MSDDTVLIADDDGNGVFPAVVALVDIDDHERNYNQHPQHQIDDLVLSIAEFGYVKKMVLQERVDGRFTVVAGHGIKSALMVAGYVNVRAEVIPADWPAHKVLAYLAADNILAQTAVVDEELLAEILRDVAIDGGEELLGAVGIPQEEMDAILEGIGLGGGDGDGGGYGSDSSDDGRLTLRERFVVPPFSVLDARQGYWQERKRAWLSLGIKSELGRGDDVLYQSHEITADGLNYDSNLTRQQGGTLGAIASNEGGTNGILARTGKYAVRRSVSKGGETYMEH